MYVLYRLIYSVESYFKHNEQSIWCENAIFDVMLERWMSSNVRDEESWAVLDLI